MSTQSRSSDLEDPLEGYSGLALFPRTLASIPNAPKPYHPDDLHHVHNFLKSMTLRSPNKILEQAKGVVNSSSGLPKSEITSCVTSKDKNEVVAAKGIENPQERRPALGRKRARFSLKPNSSQPSVNLETSLDIDKLKDPEEFFLAFEKLENARRELQKQTGGVLMDLNQGNPSMGARPRRPGILGRSVKYKHHYSNVMSSQETLEENIFSPSDYSVQQESSNPNDASQERELADDEFQETELEGSLAKSEKKVNDLLDELLSGNCEELDGDDAVPLLQEHLQIKPIDLDKLCLPDLQDVRRIDLKASKALPERRNVLSDIQNLLKGISSKTPKRCRQAESSVPSVASPTLAKSPLSSIILLKKRILQSDPLTDPFSAPDFNESAVRNAYQSESIKKQTDQVNMEKELKKSSMIEERDTLETDQINMEKELSISPKLRSSMIEGSATADMIMSLPQVATGDATHSSEQNVNDNLRRLGSDVDVGSSAHHADVESKIEGSCMDNRVVNEILRVPDTDTDLQANYPNEFDDKVEDMLPEAVDFQQPDLSMNDSTVENLNSTQIELDQANPPVVEEHVTDGPSKTADSDPEQHTEEVKISTGEPLNEQSKAISRPHQKRKRKEVSLRQSLADQANLPVVEEHVTDGPSKTADSAPEQHTEEVKISTGEPLNEQSKAISRPHQKRKRKEVSRMQSLADQANLPVVEEHVTDGPSKTADSAPEQHTEEVKMSTGEPLNEQSKAISRPHKKSRRKEFSRRQSLAASGTSWKSGVRRSTRIKSRPLEYWKGERFLYGRVHQSLTTVIGIKYASPGTDDGKPAIKVKSFVSDQYKDLVELAASF